MFGFGGGFNGPGGGSTNSGASSAPSGNKSGFGGGGTQSGPGGNSSKSGSAPSGRGSSSSSSAGREGTGGGPGGPAGTGRNSGTNGPSGQGYGGAGREGTGGGPGGPAGTGRDSGTNSPSAAGRGTPGSSPGGGWVSQAGGSTAKGDRVAPATGFTTGGGVTRGFSTPMAQPTNPATTSDGFHMFGMPVSMGSLPDPRTGPKIGIDGRFTDRPSIQIGTGDPVTTPKGDRLRGLGTPDSTVAYDRVAATSGSEITSMMARQRMARDDALSSRPTPSPSSYAAYRSTDMAQARRADENASMNAYNADRARVAAANADAHQEAAKSYAAGGVAGVGGGMAPALLSATVDKMIHAESAGKPNAKNPNSSATGLGQFIGPTWMGMMKEYHPEMMEGLTEKQIKDLRKDPALSREMTTKYAMKNIEHLAKNGIKATPSTVYAAHFLGPDGAVKAYKTLDSAPNTPAIDVFGAKVVNANKSIMQGKTVKDVIGYVDRRMNGTIADRPIFTDRYLADAKPVSDRERQLAQKDYFGSVPNQDWGAGNTEMPEADAPKQGGGVDGVQTAAAPATGPVNPPRGFPTAAGNAPVAAPGAYPDVPRSTQSEAVAGGIDVLGPMIPGVGIAIGIANAGLRSGLFSSDTRSIGERLVDDFNSGSPHAGSSGAGGRDSGNSGYAELQERFAPKVKKPGTTTPGTSFATKYLEESPAPFIDPVQRPTPAKKWGEDTNTYGSREYG